MHVSERQVVFRGNFIRRPAQPLVPDDDISNADAAASDSGSITGGRWRELDVLV